MAVGRTQDEIDEVLNNAQDDIDNGHNKFFGLTYADGVVEALRWVTGDSDEDPYPES